MHVLAWIPTLTPLVTTPPYGGGDGAAEVDEKAYFVYTITWVPVPTRSDKGCT